MAFDVENDSLAPVLLSKTFKAKMSMGKQMTGIKENEVEESQLSNTLSSNDDEEDFSVSSAASAKKGMQNDKKMRVH